jgi:hypothetical protein
MLRIKNSSLTALVVVFALTAAAAAMNISYMYGIEDQKKSQDSNLANIIMFKNGNLGPQDKCDFSAEVTGNHPSPAQLELCGDEPDRTVKVRPGAYNVHEVGESGGTLERGYDVTYSEDCSGTIKPGETVTCTITNDFTGTYP